MEYKLKAENIVKTFPGVKALDNVDFNLKKGEVHALVGENGAGKSTLVKILGGIHKKDSGKIYLNGNEYEPKSPKDAYQNGISVIHQELNLIGSQNAVENIFVGRQPLKNKIGFVDWKTMNKKAVELFEMLDMDIDLKTPVLRFGAATQQMIEIAKALSYDSEIIIMDEPSASISDKEISKLFNVINKLTDKGISIIYISHKLEEIQNIADRVTVMRNGKYVGTKLVKDVTENEIAEMMVGKEIKQENRYYKAKVEIGKEILRVENLSKEGVFKDISLSVNEGEILGIAGLVGSKRTELVRAIIGIDSKDKGDIYKYGKKIIINSPEDSAKNGIGLIPEERKTQGIIPEMNVKENISITVLDKITNMGFINQNKEIDRANEMVKDLNIKISGLEQRVKNLSGGNQQKVILAKWFTKNGDVLIFDEPTRGIDVGAKLEIYKLIGKSVRRGKGVIIISSEMEEVLNISDRVIVIDDGQLIAEMPSSEANKEMIMQKIIGKKEGE